MQQSLNQPTKVSKSLQFANFSIDYDNLTSAKQIISGLSNFTPRNVIANSPDSIIIDAGSNIGITALYFRNLYPEAKLICFEPDPHAFGLLCKNIRQNNIKDIELCNAALSNEMGDIDFFGQIFVEAPDARGNSIIENWGAQRPISNTIKVPAVQLSTYIKSRVAFLKLNIEGAEQRVIQELAQADKLRLIDEIAIEVHQSESSRHINDLNIILGLLIKHKFRLELTEKDKTTRLPAEIKDWVTKIQPQFFSLRAIRL